MWPYIQSRWESDVFCNFCFSGIMQDVIRAVQKPGEWKVKINLDIDTNFHFCYGHDKRF